VIAQVSGRLAAKQADRVMIHTAGGIGYEIVVPLGVMERLPAVGEAVSLATELVVRDDGWSLYGFQDEAERRFFQRLIGVTGVGPKIAIALMSALGVERGARAVKERNIGLLASVSGIGKKTAERLALELADKLGEFEDAASATTPANTRSGRQATARANISPEGAMRPRARKKMAAERQKYPPAMATSYTPARLSRNGTGVQTPSASSKNASSTRPGFAPVRPRTRSRAPQEKRNPPKHSTAMPKFCGMS